jgi:hypothetical protein
MPSKGASKPRSASRSRSVNAWAAGCFVLCAVTTSGCAGTRITGTPEHCIEEDEFTVSNVVDQQMIVVFKPDEDGQPTRLRELAIRIDYLEARCYGINAYRGE